MSLSQGRVPSSSSKRQVIEGLLYSHIQVNSKLIFIHTNEGHHYANNQGIQVTSSSSLEAICILHEDKQ